MNIKKSPTLIVLALILILIDSTMSTNVDFSRNSADFSINFYNQVIKEKPNENIIVSPLSVQTAVALAFMGASGKTADEIVTGLRLGTSEKLKVGANFHDLLGTYENSNILKIANKIYTQNGYEIKSEFKEIATKQFHSDAENIDFAKNEAAAKSINSWVEQKTNNKINNLIEPTSLNQDTRMVLVNAIHFKGDWVRKFKKELTKKEDFHTSKTEKFQVDMMSLTGNFKYGNFDDLNASALEMDYKDSDLSMIFILPNEIDGIAKLEENLLKKNILDFTSKMHKSEVDVKIPKFKIEFSIQLNEVLKKMGMVTMFRDADFSNLLNSAEPLKVSEVVHKAFIEVNEDGAEAAAATGMVMMMRCARPTIPFITDHPFIYLLWNRKDQTLLFMGKYFKN